MDPTAFALESPYDLIVLDNHVPAHLPRCQYLVFGSPPAGIDVNAPRDIEKQIIVDWRAQHPVLQYVNLTNLFAARSRQLELPRDADVLAEFNESPAIAFLRREGRDYLLVGFDVMQSNWPFEPGFVLFCYNALNFLGAQLGGAEPHELEVNEPIRIAEVPVESAATITGPDGSDVAVEPDADGTVRFPATQHVGVRKRAGSSRSRRCVFPARRLRLRRKPFSGPTCLCGPCWSWSRCCLPAWNGWYIIKEFGFEAYLSNTAEFQMDRIRIVFWLVLVSTAGVAAARPPEFNVDLLCGWDGCYRPMEWTPVEIGVNSDLTEPFEGTFIRHPPLRSDDSRSAGPDPVGQFGGYVGHLGRQSHAASGAAGGYVDRPARSAALRLAETAE